MIKLENLSKDYVSKKDVVTKALADINLTFEDKGMVFIIGKTGCGKSTLLNLLGLLDTPSSGDIIVDGQSIVKQDSKIEDNYRKNYVGFVFQEYNLIEEFTVYENIEVAVKLQGQKVNEEEIDNLLKRFDLYEQKYKLCNELSGGQKQRAAIIRAIVKKPKLILADEPTGALDSKTGEEILNTLKEISKEVLVIVVSHDEDYANRFADRIIEMKDGQIINDNVKATSEQKLDKVDITKVNKKARLSFKEKLKIGLFNFKHRLKKLVLMMFVAMFAFILLGTASTFVTYDKEQIIINSMYENGDDQIFITDVNKSSNETLTSPLISSQIIDEMEERYSRNFYPEYAIDNRFSDTLAYIDNAETDFYSEYEVDYALEINEEIAKDLNIDLLYGRFPSADDEVVITDFLYNLYLKFGYSYNGVYKNIVAFEDLESSTIQVEDISCKIVGVAQTNFDWNRYLPLDDIDIDDENLYLEYSYYLMTTTNKLLFLNCGFYERNVALPDNIKSTDNLRGYLENFGTSQGFYFSENYSSDTPFSSPYYYATLDYNSDNIIWKDGVARDSLADNEVVINYQLLTRGNYYHNAEKFSSILSRTEIEVENSEQYLQSERYLQLQELYNNNEINYVTYTNSLEQLKAEIATSKLFDEFGWQDLENIYFHFDLGDLQNYSVKLEVVGFVCPVTSYGSIVSDVYFSDNVFNEIVTISRAYDYVAVLTGVTSEGRDTKLLKDINKYDSMLEVYNRYTYTTTPIDNVLKGVSKLVFIVAAVLGLFAGLLFYNYIRYIIDDKRKQIGVLRSLGASKADVATIFLIESLIISIIIVTLACIGSLILTVILNNVFINVFGMILKLLTFGIFPILIVLGVCLLVSIIATILPIWQMTKKTPIETLRKR